LLPSTYVIEQLQQFYLKASQELIV
jgi:hypothetical protein